MKRLITFLLPALFAITACTIDEGGSHVKLREGETLTSFSVILPAEFSGPESYAANITDDEDVKSFHVFAFDKDDKLAEYALPEDFDPESPSLSFNVKFSDLTIGEKYTFMVLANIGGRYESLKSTLNGNPSRGDLRNALIMNESQVSNFRYIPMWGEQTVNSLEAEESITELNLLRMMARINVTVGVAPGVFKLTSVHLFNRNTQGYLIPAGTSFGDVDPVAGSRATTYDSYSDQNGGVADGQLTNMIYTFESEVPLDDASKTDFGNMHALVIGGEYEGGDETYYRVNFCKVGDDVTYLPLLRNYDYTINITKVNSAGYKKIEDAFDSNGLHMIEADVIPWNGDGKSEIAFDGQYWLSISQREWEFDAEARTTSRTDNIIRIDTDWNNGVFDISSSDETWLNLEHKDGKWYITTAVNTQETAREGTITLTAGRIKVVIEVRQLGKQAPEVINVTGITLDPSDNFTLTVGDNAKAITATVTPDNATNKTVLWTVEGNKDAIDHSVVGNTITITPESEGEVIIKATANDAGGVSKSIRVTVSNSLVISIPSELTAFLSDETMTITVTYNPAGTYIPEWTSTAPTVATVSGTTITINGVGTTKLKANVGGVFSNECTLIVSSKEPSTRAGWAGSNIYWKDGKMTFDDEFITDHDDYQGLYFKWGSLYGGAGDGSDIVYKPDGSIANIPWEDIDHVTLGSLTTTTSTYLYNNTNPVSESAKLGDICKYLTLQNGGTIHGKKWRMPSIVELGNWVSSSFSRIGPWNYEQGNTAGTATIPSGIKKEGSFFPSSGYRTPDGPIEEVGRIGHCWSSSPHNSPNAYSIYFVVNDDDWYYGYSRQYGLSVRCIVDN